MKKLSAIIIAMALVLGMAQCKKQETPTTSNANDGMVYITVNVDNGGGRHHIEPSVGAYVFTNGDALYVGNDGHYVGTLTYSNGTFSGTIDSPVSTDYLHFYFLGGKEPASAPTTNTTDFTINIANQSSNLPILAYGRSTEFYGASSYTTTLRNKCALVKFDLVMATNDAVTVSGMLTEATIDFATPGITPTATTGTMTLYSESETEKWAIHTLQAVMFVAVVFGSVKEADLVWQLGDIGVGLMAWFTIISILILCPKAIKALKDYESKKSLPDGPEP